MLLFSYGSNSITQIKNRINLLDNLSYEKGYIKDYVRIFAGKSLKWENGGISSIYFCKGKKVHGIIVNLSLEQINQLNTYEKGYTLEEKNVIINKKIEKCFVYVKNNNVFKKIPSESYLIAINNMLNEITHKNQRKINIRCIINNKLKLIGYWNINNGYIFL